MSKKLYSGITALIFLFFTASSAGAWSFLDTVPWSTLEEGASPGSYPGSPLPGLDGRTLGMGGTGVASAEGAAAVFYNPANMPLGPRREAAAGFSAYSLTEGDREDNISSAVMYKGPSFAFIMPLGKGLRIGLGHRALADMNYEHQRKIYEDGIYNSLDMKQSGGINKFSLAGGLNVTGKLSVGVCLDFITGSSETDFIRTERIEPDPLLHTNQDWQPNRDVHEAGRDFSGTALRMGGGYSLMGDTLRLGIAYGLAYEIEDDWELKSEGEEYDHDREKWEKVSEVEIDSGVKMKMPGVLGVGLRYDFLGRDYAVITLDIERVYWSDYEYEDSEDDEKRDPGFRDITRIGAGVEHELTRNILIRYGFIFLPHYGDTSVDLTMFTLGTGFYITDSLDIDIGMAFGRRSYRAENLFCEWTDYSEISTDESLVKALAGVNWRF